MEKTSMFVLVAELSSFQWGPLKYLKLVSSSTAWRLAAMMAYVFWSSLGTVPSVLSWAAVHADVRS